MRFRVCCFPRLSMPLYETGWMGLECWRYFLRGIAGDERASGPRCPFGLDAFWSWPSQECLYWPPRPLRGRFSFAERLCRTRSQPDPSPRVLTEEAEDDSESHPNHLDCMGDS